MANCNSWELRGVVGCVGGTTMMDFFLNYFLYLLDYNKDALFLLKAVDVQLR